MTALPRMVINEKVALVSVVLEKRCLLLLDWLLVGEAGGRIPVDPGATDAKVTGHSTVDRPGPEP